jgi:acetyl-CoA synthetase
MPAASKQLLELAPAWVPSLDFVRTTNIAWLMQRTGMKSYEALHAWSVQHRDQYWNLAIERLGVSLRRPFDRIMDLSDGLEQPRWLPGAKYNIVESCFAAPADSPAIIYQAEGGPLASMTVGELKTLAIRVAANLRRHGFQRNASLAIVMPMTAESVAIYLGIILAGCVAVGIADSFQPKEIATRLRAARVTGVFTQDFQVRGGKALALYANIIEADSPPAIVLPAKDRLSLALRKEDIGWSEFLEAAANFEPVFREPSQPITILFSSGTTGEPKAIPWTHTTPIKCAADAHFHHDVHRGDVLVWPTNLGWMMGPWLVFASLLNRASMGLFYGATTGAEFGRFVQDAKATMLGVVPSLVRAWRHTDRMRDFNWHNLRVLSSTGECSHPDDMHWLMSLAGGRPVIEYCGGTEIGGAYITGTVTKPCVPATFNTAALGLDFVILDEREMPAEKGEAFVVPPSIGLSNTVLNNDHHEIYFAATPRGPQGQVLRRHGDEMQNLGGGYWRALGRADDTMNLGGIKVSSAEIEHALQSVPQVKEAAAIAISPDGGPSQLIIYAACSAGPPPDKGVLQTAMQDRIKRDLNPLFRIRDLVLVDALPRTPSNKVMRRVLRDRYLSAL